jgi:creatinine amidohydrolase
MKIGDSEDDNSRIRSTGLLEEMNAVQVKRNINEKTIAILVFGACENHGDHMPFGSDFIFPMELAKRIAGKLDKKNSIILPAIPYGIRLHHNEFQMTTCVVRHRLVMVLDEMFR